MRWRTLLLLLLLLTAACGGTTADPARLTAGVLLPAEVGAASPDAVTLVGVLVRREPPLLSAALTVDGTPLTADGQALALSSAELLRDIDWQAFGPTDARLVELRGRLQPVGSALQLVPSQLRELTPQPTGLAALAQLSGPRLVEIEAQLLAAGGSYLLVSELTDGGVPTTTSLQFKLRVTTDDAQLLDRLQRAGSVAYGPVTVIALWRDQLLTGLVVTPRADP